MSSALTWILLAALTASAAKKDEAPVEDPASPYTGVRRGDFDIQASLKGSALPHQTWPAFAPHDGRVQSVMVLPGQWVSERETLAVLVDQELAALLESEPTTPPEIVAKRWGKIYRPTEIRCPFPTAYVSQILVRSNQRVKSGDPILSVAPSLKLVSELPPELSGSVGTGGLASVWPVDDPSRIFSGTVFETRPGENGRPAEVTVLLPPRLDGIDSGTPLEGRLLFRRTGVLAVPLRGVQEHEGRTFMTVEVRLGVDNGSDVELLTPLADGTAVLLPAKGLRRAPKEPRAVLKKKPTREESDPGVAQ